MHVFLCALKYDENKNLMPTEQSLVTKHYPASSWFLLVVWRIGETNCSQGTEHLQVVANSTQCDRVDPT